MKKTILLFIFIAGLFIIGCSGDKNQDAESQNIAVPVASGNNVIIKDFSFNPGEINVKIGDKVTWSNNDNVKHTVTSDSGDELNSELFGKGEKYEHVFNVAGEYNYYCKPHPYMKGKVIVS